MARWSWIAMVAAFTACGGDKTDDATAGGDADTDADTDTDTDTGGGGGGTTDVTPQSLTLTVTDPSGGAISGIDVKFCNSIGCIIQATDASGTVLFENAKLMPYSLEPVPPADSGLATPFVPITFEEDEDKVLTVVMPPLEPATDLGGSTEVAYGDLRLTVSASTVQAPDPFSPAPTEVAGVQVDPAMWPPINLSGTVLGVWYLAPFNYASAEGLPARFANSFGLTEGATAHVYVGSYDDFEWLDGGTVTTGADGFLTGASLPKLSTVVLVQE